MLGVLESVIINYEHQWSIDFDYFKEFDTKIASPIISLLTKNHIDTKWQLWMTRTKIKVGETQEDILNIFVENLNDFDITAEVSILILNDRLQVFKTNCLPIHLFTSGERCIPQNEKISLPYSSFNKLLKNNKITIGYNINIDHSKVIILRDENKFCRLKQFDQLEKLFMNQESSDIVIKAGEKEFYAHKCIMEIFSPVFEAMFQHEFLEKRKNIVEVVDIKPEVFEEFLRFFYTGKVNEIDKIETELLYAAEKYLVQGLKLLCEDNILKKISLENAVEYLELAIKCNANNLKNNIINFISCNPKELCQKQEQKSPDQ